MLINSFLSAVSGVGRCLVTAKLLMVGLMLSLGALAEVPADVSERIVKQLKGARGDLDYQVVSPAPLDGFYEVQVQGGPLLYVSVDGKHFFDGNLYQVRPGQFVNIRDLRLNEMRQEIFAGRDTGDMIIFKPEGATKAIMNVFTDVDCGYCRKLHREVPELNAMGIEVRYLAYPRAGIPSESYNKIATAWCADNQQDVFTRTKNGEKIPSAVCTDNPVAEHFELGRQVGVTGTPAVILMDGTLIPGYQPAADFARVLGLSQSDS
ncbi:MAG: thioredoxin fold domain-containing protein [Porticoccaceae bacterium]